MKTDFKKRKNKTQRSPVIQQGVPAPAPAVPAQPLAPVKAKPVDVPSLEPNVEPTQPYISPTQVRLYSLATAGANVASGVDGVRHCVSGAGAGAVPAAPPVFKIPSADGPFRDKIVVEVVGPNGQQYNCAEISFKKCTPRQLMPYQISLKLH